MQDADLALVNSLFGVFKLTENPDLEIFLCWIWYWI